MIHPAETGISPKIEMETTLGLQTLLERSTVRCFNHLSQMTLHALSVEWHEFIWIPELVDSCWFSLHVLLFKACSIQEFLRHGSPQTPQKNAIGSRISIFLQLAIVTKSPAYTAYTWTILMESYGYDSSIKCLGIYPSGCNPSTFFSCLTL
jgi:hypothetical protein